MQVCAELWCLLVQWQLLALSAVVAALVALAFSFIRPRKGSTYLIDFYCLRPPNRCSTLAIHSHPLTLSCTAAVRASWLLGSVAGRKHPCLSALTADEQVACCVMSVCTMQLLCLM